MAAKQLDEVWDSQVAILNTSYASTVNLLDQGKVKEAAAEFHANFAQAVKKLYSEAPSTYPERFSKIDDWCSWIKNLYVTSAKADKALAAGNGAEAKKLLGSMRDSFYKLHQETQTQKAPDVAYAIYLESLKDAPDAAAIKALDAKLAEAKPAASAKSGECANARAEYDKAVAPLLSDGKLDASELPALRSAAKALYKSCGMQFE